MTLAEDGLPISEIDQIDAEISERIRSLPNGPIADGDLAQIRDLRRRRMEMTRPALFDEARELLDSIAAAG
jgi:hypothetical protein